MIKLKSKTEIGALREAGRLAAMAQNLVASLVGPGVTTLELDEAVCGFLRSHGAESAFKNYRGFPGNICSSINEEIVHGIPSKRKLKEGDIVSVDVGVRYKRYIGDCARTYSVEPISLEARNVLDVCEAALYKAIEVAQPRERLSTVSRTIQQYVEGHGLSVVREFTGHGVGAEMHEDPQVPNFVDSRWGFDVKLKPGLVIAIEPMVNGGTHETSKVIRQNWEVIVTKDGKPSAHFEHTVAITEDGPVILTEP
ncbi:MAG: type I methionyl aminopeptidase [Planctomycetes bacterium]|nr:type I methionyl aminopeptidase [Planctomycetota bacterium]